MPLQALALKVLKTQKFYFSIPNNNNNNNKIIKNKIIIIIITIIIIIVGTRFWHPSLKYRGMSAQ